MQNSRFGSATSLILRIILFAASFGLIAVFAVSMSMWLLVQLDNGGLRTAIRDAFVDGAIVAKSGSLFDLRRGDYLFNDCLILQALLLERDNWRHSIIDSTIYLNDEPCRTLELDVMGERPSTSTYQYSRYMFAARVVSAPLIAVVGIDHAKQFVRALTYFTLLLTALISIRGLARRAQMKARPRTIYSAGLICVAAMLGFYRLEYYSQTLAHGYSELVLAGFLLYSVTFASAGAQDRVPTASIVFGVLTGCFELLTGPALIAVGMAVLMSHCAAPTRPHPCRHAAMAGLGCAAGVLITVLWQQAIISAVSDAKPFYQFITHLAMRLQLHQFLPIPFEPNWATPENLHLYSPRDVVDSMIATLPNLTYKSSIAALIVFGCSAIAVALGPALSRRATRPGCVIAAAVALTLPLWYFAFSNHTVLHSLYMVRMCVLLPICAGISLMFVLAPDSWLASQRPSLQPTRDHGLGFLDADALGGRK